MATCDSEYLILDCAALHKLESLAHLNVEHGGRILMNGTIVEDKNAHAGTGKAARRFRPTASRHTPGIRFHTHPLVHIPQSPADVQAYAEEVVMRSDLLPATLVADRSGLYIMCLPQKFITAAQRFKKKYPDGFSNDEMCLTVFYGHQSGKLAKEYRKKAEEAFSIADSPSIKHREGKQRRYISELRERGIPVYYYSYKSLRERAGCNGLIVKPIKLPMACSKSAYGAIRHGITKRLTNGAEAPESSLSKTLRARLRK